MKNFLKQLLFTLLLLGLPLSAQADSFEKVVVELPIGAGVVVSSDGLVVIPQELTRSSRVIVDGMHQQAEVALDNPESPFGLLKLNEGPYFTLALGDFDAINSGVEVVLATTSGTEKVKVDRQFTDVTTNHQVLTLNRAYDGTVLGSPVLDEKMEVIALITGSDPDDPTKCLATSIQELKLLLFNEGWPPLTQRPLDASSNEPNAENRSTGADKADMEILEWDFPLGSGTDQRPGDLLRMREWRQSTGFSSSQIAPLAVSPEEKLYLATRTGGIYSLDVPTQQRVWRNTLGSEGGVFFAPLILDSQVLVLSGNLGLGSIGVRRTGDPLIDFFQDLAGRTHNRVSSNTGQVYSFDIQTGEELWRLPTRFASNPMLDGNTVYLSGFGLLGAVNTKTGLYKWVFDKEKRGRNPLWYSLQVQEDDVLYGVRVPIRIHGGAESNHTLHLKGGGDTEVVAINKRDGSIRWSTRLRHTSNLFEPLGSTVQKNDDILHVIVQKRVFGVDPKTGNLRYEYLRTDRASLDHLVVEEGKVFGADSEGWYALEATTGETLWRHRASEPEVAPLIKDGVLYGMGHHSLVALDTKTGKKKWEKTFEYRLSGQPTIQGNHLYCVSLEGKIWRVTLPK